MPFSTKPTITLSQRTISTSLDAIEREARADVFSKSLTQSLTVGADNLDFVGKPYQREELAQKLRSAIGS